MVGISLVTVPLPNEKVTVEDSPAVVPTPTDCCGLKYTLSFTFESKNSKLESMVSEFGLKLTIEVVVWETPVKLLSTFNALLFLNTSKISKVSDPIEILLPTETFWGILAT